MPCAATQTGLWCPLGLNVLQARNPDSNAPIQRLATMRLPWRQNTLRFLPIDAQAPGLLGHICRSISSRTHKHAGKRRAAIMNKTSADATRLTAPPALHWARDSRAHHPRRHGLTSTFYQFFFSVETEKRKGGDRLRSGGGLAQTGHCFIENVDLARGAALHPLGHACFRGRFPRRRRCRGGAAGAALRGRGSTTACMRRRRWTS